MSKKSQKTTQDKIHIDIKQNMTTKQMFSKINQSNNIDRILIQFGLQKYEHKAVIQGKPTFSQVEQFFLFLKTKQEELQQEYLQVSVQAEESQQNLNYLQNKNNIQKFIKDQHEFYMKVLLNHQENVNQDEKGLNANKIPDFLKQLLGGKHTKCMLKNKQYFASRFEDKLKLITQQFATQTKEISKQQFSYQNFYLMEEQILDYLTFWLKDQQNTKMHVIYARTEKILSRHIKIKQNEQNARENYKASQFRANIKEQNSQNKMEPIQQKILSEVNPTSQLKGGIIVEKPYQVGKNILNKNKNDTQILHDQVHQQLKKSLSRQSLTKQQRFAKALPELYSMACKKRAKIHRGITFDQYLADKNMMTLQKFINFCNDATISKYLSRQFLMDTFKIYAINRLTADQKIFIQIMNQLVQKNQQILPLTLKKYRNQLQSKQKTTKSIEKSKLSKYSYRLRPVNGMDLQSIQAQLKVRKQEKEQVKQVKRQKQNQIIKIQVGYMAKHKANKKKGNSYSNYTLPERTEVMGQFPIKQDKFDPENIISNYHQNDKLWDQYQAKIWKKQKPNNLNQSILQSALSKRIQKGQNVLRKFTQKNLKVYS